MRALGPSKPMVSVEGTALLEMVLKNAHAGGVEQFVVVTGYNGEPLRAFVETLAHRLHLDVTCVDNRDWHLGNGRSVLAARSYVQDPFHVLMADHLVDPNILRIVRQGRLPDHGACLAVDSRLRNPHVDLEDVTKVMRRDDVILAIGKNLTAFNSFDTGVFWATSGLFDAIEESISTSGDDSLSGGIRVLAAAAKMTCCDIGNRTWIDVDTPAVLDLAQQALVDSSRTGI